MHDLEASRLVEIFVYKVYKDYNNLPITCMNEILEKFHFTTVLLKKLFVKK
jgi:hypothetical protein